MCRKVSDMPTNSDQNPRNPRLTVVIVCQSSNVVARSSRVPVDFGTFRLVSNTSLTTPLSESLDLRISLVDEYDNDPEVAGVKKNDLTFRTTLVFRF